jgi:hypothetical protein
LHCAGCMQQQIRTEQVEWGEVGGNEWTMHAVRVAREALVLGVALQVVYDSRTEQSRAGGVRWVAMSGPCRCRQGRM